LVIAADSREHGSDGRVGEGRREIGGAVGRGLVGELSHTRQARAEVVVDARIACSCTSGPIAGAAKDGETTATRAPGSTLGGTRGIHGTDLIMRRTAPAARMGG
jgi:hypothetical protein